MVSRETVQLSNNSPWKAFWQSNSPEHNSSKFSSFSDKICTNARCQLPDEIWKKKKKTH